MVFLHTIVRFPTTTRSFSFKAVLLASSLPFPWIFSVMPRRLTTLSLETGLPTPSRRYEPFHSFWKHYFCLASFSFFSACISLFFLHIFRVRSTARLTLLLPPRTTRDSSSLPPSLRTGNSLRTPLSFTTVTTRLSMVGSSAPLPLFFGSAFFFLSQITFQFWLLRCWVPQDPRGSWRQDSHCWYVFQPPLQG